MRSLVLDLAPYSIHVYKQNFNFACAHFMLFENGTRETLHGHNYRVEIEGENSNLNNDMVFDFLDIKPVIREICQELDHHLLIPKLHPQLKIETKDSQVFLQIPDGSTMSFPQGDVYLLPVLNTSVERLAIYFGTELKLRIKNKFNYCFKKLKVTIEETPGQCASVWIE